MGTSAHQQQITHSDKVGRPAEGPPDAVSLNKFVESPSNPTGIFREGSLYWDTDRLVGLKGLGFPGALMDISNTRS